MRLSNKGRYGVQALFDIAFHNDGQATQIKDIAEREAIPPRFLEQIFQDLKRAGLVAAKRGPRGGYHLTRPASEIRLGDVIRVLEGPMDLAGRADGSSGQPDPRSVPELVFRELSERIERCFDEVTVGDICKRGEELGLGRRHAEPYIYVI